MLPIQCNVSRRSGAAALSWREEAVWSFDPNPTLCHDLRAQGSQRMASKSCWLSSIDAEDITQESPAQDPSLSTFSQPGYLQLPSFTVNLPLPYRSLVTRARALLNRVHPCQLLFVDSCCSIHVCTSLMSSALVTDAPTLALAHVLADEKCQTSSSHVHPPSVHRSGSKLVEEQL